MSNLISFDKEVLNEIMSCDVYIKVVSDHKPISELQRDVSEAFDLFRDFDSRFSRFKSSNELALFNESTSIKVSEDLFLMLKKALWFNHSTNGVFDIGILNQLVNEGYSLSKNEGFIDAKHKSTEKRFITSGLIQVDEKNRTVSKPAELKVDLGGIGKGFIVDKVADFFRSKGYLNFVVDAGGDMYFSGKDIENSLNNWLTEIEDPYENHENETRTTYLKLSNAGIATSGVNKRKWLKNKESKNHLIDTKTLKSVHNELICITTIQKEATSADVWAKTLLLMGLENGQLFAEKMEIPAVFYTKDKRIIISSKARSYVYQN